MGFWDVSAFNLAMLAKQAWRVIHNNQSLFYRVYKVRYFPNCSFMLAVLGLNPSFVWRSLLVARDVIREGSTWRVGDGQNIGVLSHKWLQNKPVFLNEHNDQMRVNNLINHDTRQWDRGKLVATYTQSTCAEYGQQTRHNYSRLSLHTTLLSSWNLENGQSTLQLVNMVQHGDEFGS